MFEVKVCKVNSRGAEDCTKIKVSRTMIQALLMLMGVAAVVNFFIGTAIGGPILGLMYVGFSLILSLIAILCLIPIFGLVVLLLYYNAWTIAIISMIGIPMLAWTQALLTTTWVLGLIAQIVGMIYIIIRILAVVRKGGFGLPGLF